VGILMPLLRILLPDLAHCIADEEGYLRPHSPRPEPPGPWSPGRLRPWYTGYAGPSHRHTLDSTRARDAEGGRKDRESRAARGVPGGSRLRRGRPGGRVRRGCTQGQGGGVLLGPATCLELARRYLVGCLAVYYREQREHEWVQRTVGGIAAQGPEGEEGEEGEEGRRRGRRRRRGRGIGTGRGRGRGTGRARQLLD